MSVCTAILTYLGQVLDIGTNESIEHRDHLKSLPLSLGRSGDESQMVSLDFRLLFNIGSTSRQKFVRVVQDTSNLGPHGETPTRQFTMLDYLSYLMTS